MKQLTVIFLALLAQLSFGSAPHADISKAWFQPKLIESHDATVCDPLLAGYTQYFTGTGKSNPLKADFHGNRENTESLKNITRSLSEIPWVALDTQGYTLPSSEKLRIAETNVDGQYFGLIQRNFSIGWREGYSMVIATDKPFASLDIPSDGLSGYFSDNELVAITKHENGEYELLSRANPKLNDSQNAIYVTPVNTYSKDQQIYVLFALSRFGKGAAQGERYGVFKVANEGSLNLVCEIQTEPSRNEIEKHRNAINVLPKYIKVVSDMLGGGGNCGTLNSPARARGAMDDAFESMIYRPWANNFAGRYSRWDNSEQRINAMVKNLKKWGYTGIWNYHKFNEFESLGSTVENQLSRFYADNYNLDQEHANEWALSSIAYALVMAFNHGQVYDKNFGLHKLILDGVSAEQLLTATIPSNIDALKGYGMEGGDSLLAYAILRPGLVKVLLEKGLDPNKGNNFNKTPLMYAAQFNDIESAKLLLEYGADTDISTTKAFDSCTYTIRSKNVTALHYAVRYASEEFIRLLIDHGALKTIKDSNNKTPLDYLVNFGGRVSHGQPDNTAYGLANRLLSEGDVESLKDLLSPISEEQSRVQSKKENLIGEKFYQEKSYQQALTHFRRAILINSKDFRAKSNFSVTALKLGKSGESAMVSNDVIQAEASDKIKSSAYFNLGLACETNGKDNKNYHGPLHYDSIKYCYHSSETLLDNFLHAYELRPTKSRLNKIVKVLSDVNREANKRACAPANSSTGLRSIYIEKEHVYFLLDKGANVPYKTMSSNSGRDSVIATEIKTLSLSVEYDLVRWKTSDQLMHFDITFDNGDTCFK
ncbi:MAG: ankyrin repeat protein [Flavobacteriales bacterium]|jgi:ankyrin repeat protein